ncbi:MAG TPA: hypothetical protein VE869_04600 [Gemmatimonas sp.]|nr:hypothetical protein [Gemmatimonas sp.]
MPAITRRRARSTWRSIACAVACAVAVPLVTACSTLTDTSSQIGRYAAVSIAARSSSADAATGTATVIVFDAYTAIVPNSTLERRETCRFLSFEGTTPDMRGQQRAGDAVGFQVGARNLSLEYDAVRMRYALPSAGTFAYAKGDVATITIPGAAGGYPASNISVKLAEPVVPGVIAVPAPGEPFSVRWNAVSDPTSLVIISLRYGTGGAGSALSEQLYCTATDDGLFEIQASSLFNFQSSPVATRSLSITRFRSNQSLIDPRTLIFVGSTADSVIALR